jgi:hypothetical protein
MSFGRDWIYESAKERLFRIMNCVAGPESRRGVEIMGTTPLENRERATPWAKWFVARSKRGSAKGR